MQSRNKLCPEVKAPDTHWPSWSGAATQVSPGLRQNVTTSSNKVTISAQMTQKCSVFWKRRSGRRLAEGFTLEEFGKTPK